MTHLEHELQKLKNNLTEMSELVLGQLTKSIDAMFNADIDLAHEVVSNERRVNACELRIDRICENISTLHGPFAGDMKFVFGTLKINSNLERIGDYAEVIADCLITGGTAFEQELLACCRVNEMSSEVLTMFQCVHKAYLDNNPVLARQVFQKDTLLDTISNEAADKMVDYIKQHPNNVKMALSVFTIIKKLERAGDHITNIAEEIIFYSEFKVLKHQKTKTE